jgi:predicted ATP-grasp superfamily ATP-dependent carboligase
MPKVSVLLTSGWLRSSYSVLSNLNKFGISVHVSDTGKLGMSQFSRYKKGVHTYTSHYESEKLFVKDLKEICKRERINLIFPSHNETEVLAQYRETLGEDLCRLVPKYEHCTLFNNKSAAYDYAESHGIPVPERYQYENPSDLIHLLKDVGPVVIKLLTGNSSKGVYFAEEPVGASVIVKELIDRYQLTPSRYPQVEQRVEGEGWGCSVLYWKGKPIADFTHRRLREKIITGGTSTLRQQRDHAGIREAAHKIFSCIGWHGLAMCEFKVCLKTGRFWFIEVNPRMWGSIPLAIDAGVEFPYLAFLCADKSPEEARRYFERSILRINHKSKWMLGELSLVTKYLIRLRLISAFRILFEKVDSIDDFHWNDLLPFVGQILRYCLNSLGGLSFNPEEKGMLK